MPSSGSDPSDSAPGPIIGDVAAETPVSGARRGRRGHPVAGEPRSRPGGVPGRWLASTSQSANTG